MLLVQMELHGKSRLEPSGSIVILKWIQVSPSVDISNPVSGMSREWRGSSRIATRRLYIFARAIFDQGREKFWESEEQKLFLTTSSPVNEYLLMPLLDLLLLEGNSSKA
jgi:hypothetical protein